MNNLNNRLTGVVFGEVLPSINRAQSDCVNAEQDSSLGHYPRTAENIEKTRNSSDSTLEINNLKIKAFTDDCLTIGESSPELNIVGLLEDNFPMEHVYERVLVSVARELGDRWSRDEIGFIEVHLGVLRLQSIARKIQELLPINVYRNSINAAVSATPGDQHIFGASLATNVMIRSGWRVSNFSGLEMEECVSAIQNETYSVVAFSLYRDENFDTLCETVRRLKANESFQSTIVLVTGDYFLRNPDSWLKTGATACVSSIEEAVRFVESSISSKSEPVLPTQII